MLENEVKQVVVGQRAILIWYDRDMAWDSFVEQTGLLHSRARQDLNLEPDPYPTPISNPGPTFLSLSIVVKKCLMPRPWN